MKKIVLLATVPILTLGLGLGSALAAEGKKVAAPTKPTQVTSFGKKDPVTFDHSKHKYDKNTEDAKCKACHHVKGNEKGEHKCGTCHGKDDDAKTKAIKLESAAHKKDVGVCYKCHRADEAKNKMKCADCHKK